MSTQITRGGELNGNYRNYRNYGSGGRRETVPCWNTMQTRAIKKTPQTCVTPRNCAVLEYHANQSHQKKHHTNLRDTAQLCRSGIPCNQSHQKKHHTNLRAAVKKDRGSGGKKIVEERNNCHPSGAEPAAKNLVIFPQKSGKMTNLFDANSPLRRPACQATYSAPGRAGRQGCRGRAQSPLQKANKSDPTNNAGHHAGNGRKAPAKSQRIRSCQIKKANR